MTVLIQLDVPIPNPRMASTCQGAEVFSFTAVWMKGRRKKDIHFMVHYDRRLFYTSCQKRKWLPLKGRKICRAIICTIRSVSFWKSECTNPLWWGPDGDFVCFVFSIVLSTHVLKTSISIYNFSIRNVLVNDRIKALESSTPSTDTPWPLYRQFIPNSQPTTSTNGFNLSYQ